MEINFSIEDNTLIRNEVIPHDTEDNVFIIKKIPIFTKDVFVECYKRWIKGEENE